jgi:hypothetical protein
MPGPVRRTGGMSSVNQPDSVTADQPFWITVNSTKPRGMRTMTRANPISNVARVFRTDRPERFGLKSVGRGVGGAVIVVVMRLESSGSSD